LDIARDHPYKMHFSMPFDPHTGDGSSPVPAGISYSRVVGETLYRFLGEDEDTIVLTPATPYASGIEKCLEDFPDRVYDVGMAEQHCIGMAVGLALKGKKVFACFQSTFLQRSMDQIFHDACYMDVPITIISSRSGFSGFDSPTHHGIYDLSYLRAIPNLSVFYAGTTSDLKRILLQRQKQQTGGPLVVLHPYENIWEEGESAFPVDDDLSKASVAFDGKDGFIFSTGNRLPAAFQLRDLLAKEKLDFGVLNVRWIKPAPVEQLTGIIKRTPRIVTLEENVRSAGFGSSIDEIVRKHGLSVDLFISAIDDGFVPAGEKDHLSRLTGIDAETVFKQLVERWGL
jgi:1-deoxy-D-xylulose-5-phosphate synthase